MVSCTAERRVRASVPVLVTARAQVRPILHPHSAPCRLPDDVEVKFRCGDDVVLFDPLEVPRLDLDNLQTWSDAFGKNRVSQTIREG